MSVTYPREFIADSLGRPLENGAAYVGVANQDPQVNPVQCYWDAAMTTPATQPIDISAGYLMNTGTRADVHTAAGSYSLRIRDKQGSLVDYIPAIVQNGGYLDWTQFGIVGDGVTDDTTALATAIAAAITQRATLRLPPDIKTGAQTVSGACCIEGVGGKTVLTAKSGTYDTFTITGADVTIRNLYIQDSAKTGGVDFLISVGTGQVDRTRIENILCFNSYGFFADSGSGAGYHATTILKDIQARVLRGPGVAMTRLLAFGEWDEVTMEYFASASPNYTAFSVNGAGIVSDAVGGLKIKGCTASGTMAAGGATSSQKGFVFTSFSDIEMDALADSLGGDAFTFTTVNKLQISTAKASLCDGRGFVLTGVTNSILSNLIGAGRNGEVVKTAGEDGICFVSGCSNVMIGTALMRDFTSHGVEKVAAQAGVINIGNLQAQGNTGRGVKTVGSSVFSVNGGTLAANAAGNYDLGAATDRLFDTVINDGTVANVTGAATG